MRSGSQCTQHRRPHDFKRECLKYKAQITYNGKCGSHNSPTILMFHDDVLPQIRKFVAEHSDVVDWKQVVRTNSLPCRSRVPRRPGCWLLILSTAGLMIQ